MSGCPLTNKGQAEGPIQPVDLVAWPLPPECFEKLNGVIGVFFQNFQPINVSIGLEG